MFIPNGFKPSKDQEQYTYDPEGRLRVSSLTRGSVGGIGESNSLYATEAEKFGTMAPFLKRAKKIDQPRRNYVIQPGGASIYFDGPAPGNPYDDRVEYEAPEERDTFGHMRPVNAPEASNMRRFTIGEDGRVR